MLISKKTWCFGRKCDCNLTRQPINSESLFFIDECDKCNAKKFTLLYFGDVEYYYGDGTKVKAFC